MSSPAPDLARSEPLVPSAVLGMAIFIAAELMFYGGLISAFLVLKAQAVSWPPFDQPRLPVGVTAVNTGVLLSSGWAMQRAHRALRRSETGFARWLGFTWLLGALFLTVQGAEWVRLVHFGLTTSSSLYGATFYTLVGAHACHVVAALVMLAVVRRLAARGHFRPGDGVALEPYRMYWFSVVGIWPLLYLLVYLA